jgi:uncharacterized protein
MSSLRSRLLAVAEVLAVFVLTRIVVAIWLVAALGLDIRSWGARYLIYGSWIALALLLVAARRGDWRAYGLAWREVVPQARLGLSLFLPFAIVFFITGFLVPQVLLPGKALRWPQELLGAAAWIGLLFWISRLLDRRLAPVGTATGRRAGMSLPVMMILPVAAAFANMTLGERLTGFVFYLVFLGPGEEILYRGYVQSRLNEAFGRPFRLLGVDWGWGLVIGSTLFGLMHAFNSFNPSLGQYGFNWAWAVSAGVAGLVFGYLRERTGSVVPGSVMHGLPQAIAALVMRF